MKIETKTRMKKLSIPDLVSAYSGKVWNFRLVNPELLLAWKMNYYSKIA